MLTEHIKDLTKQLREAQRKRKEVIGNSIIHDDMSIQEVYDSLRKHKFFGKYNGRFYQENENTKVFIVKIR